MRIQRLTGLLVLFAATAAAAGDQAGSGKFSFRDVEYVAVDAIAWHTPGEYPSSQVALSDKPFDAAAIGADGVVDDTDLMAHAGATLMVSYMPEDNTVLGIRLRNETGHGADFRCEGQGLLTLTSVQESVIAGTFTCEEHQVSFTAPVLDTPGR